LRRQCGHPAPGRNSWPGPHAKGSPPCSASAGIDDSAIDEYWKAYADDTRRQGQLDFYRSMDFEKIAPYDGKLAALGVPVLLVFGGQDPFVSPATAHRFERDLPDTDLVLIEDAGHFVWEDAPERCAEALRSFLAKLG
jgi:haloalkane dehalogenase